MPFPLVAGVALFLAGMAYLVASSLIRRQIPMFPPSPVGVPVSAGTGPRMITLDARGEAGWRYVDLDVGVPLAAGDSTGWDLAVRRFRLRTHVGDLGRWYTYGALSHLLEPAGPGYRVRTDLGRTAVLAIVSYYCPGPAAGCFTLRYRLVPEVPPGP
jgi:hypothetical protein